MKAAFEKMEVPVDVLINCAGFSELAVFEEMPLDEHHRLMDVNYFGAVHCTHAVLAGMKARKDGRVCFVSSIAGQFGLHGMTGYTASKLEEFSGIFMWKLWWLEMSILVRFWRVLGVLV